MAAGTRTKAPPEWQQGRGLRPRLGGSRDADQAPTWVAAGTRTKPLHGWQQGCGPSRVGHIGKPRVRVRGRSWPTTSLPNKTNEQTNETTSLTCQASSMMYIISRILCWILDTVFIIFYYTVCPYYIVIINQNRRLVSCRPYYTLTAYSKDKEMHSSRTCTPSCTPSQV